jgi:periplasmic protein CpxP/Spy
MQSRPFRYAPFLLAACLAAGPALAAAPGPDAPGAASAAAQTSAAPAPAAAATPPAQAGSVPKPQAEPQTPEGKRVAADVEHRIKDLGSRLNITPAQQPLWNDFANTMRQNALDMDTLFQQRAERLESLNAVDDMRNYATVAQAHADHIQRLLPVFEALYNSMTPQQKKTTDETFKRAQREGMGKH